ncbi:MAG: HincII family type II restriction endonuclease [Candidatus Aenigmarchaeota archaeon]|nr:HincII family type II restriction endonuclease [Candidatus Aenigmarchaeota archaeon]
MYETDKIKREVTKQLKLELSKGAVIKGLNKADAYGHEAGMPFEEWVKEFLLKNKWKVFFPNEFIEENLQIIGQDEEKIEEFLDSTWWSSLLRTKQQIKDFLVNKPVKRWQQEGADLVLFYGKDMKSDFEKVILINVKSHEISRLSRAPNIMSAQRLLEFCHEIISREDYQELLKKLDLWFMGIYWENHSSGAIIKEAHIKDLFKLDIKQIPQINFDAAIQIQWHVKEMVEKEQTKEQFIGDLADSFLEQWQHHSQQKQSKYELLVSHIKEKLSR